MTELTCEMHDQVLQFNTPEQLIWHLETDLSRIAKGETLDDGKFRSILL